MQRGGSCSGLPTSSFLSSVLSFDRLKMDASLFWHWFFYWCLELLPGDWGQIPCHSPMSSCSGPVQFI